jgi:hypothetical protein
MASPAEKLGLRKLAESRFGGKAVPFRESALFPGFLIRYVVVASL